MYIPSHFSQFPIMYSGRTRKSSTPDGKAAPIASATARQDPEIHGSGRGSSLKDYDAIVDLNVKDLKKGAQIEIPLGAPTIKRLETLLPNDLKRSLFPLGWERYFVKAVYDTVPTRNKTESKATYFISIPLFKHEIFREYDFGTVFSVNWDWVQKYGLWESGWDGLQLFDERNIWRYLKPEEDEDNEDEDSLGLLQDDEEEEEYTGMLQDEGPKRNVTEDLLSPIGQPVVVPGLVRNPQAQAASESLRPKKVPLPRSSSVQVLLPVVPEDEAEAEDEDDDEEVMPPVHRVGLSLYADQLQRKFNYLKKEYDEMTEMLRHLDDKELNQQIFTLLSVMASNALPTETMHKCDIWQRLFTLFSDAVKTTPGQIIQSYKLRYCVIALLRYCVTYCYLLLFFSTRKVSRSLSAENSLE